MYNNFDYKTSFVLPTENGNILRKTSKGIWFENESGEILRPSNEGEWQNAIHSWGVAPIVHNGFAAYKIVEGSVLCLVYKRSHSKWFDETLSEDELYLPEMAYDIETQTAMEFEYGQGIESDIAKRTTIAVIQSSMDSLRNEIFKLIPIALENEYVSALKQGDEMFFEPFCNSWMVGGKPFSDIREEISDWEGCEISHCEIMFAILDMMLAYELLSREYTNA